MRKYSNSTVLSIFALCLLAIAAGAVIADPSAPTTLTQIATSTRDLSTQSAQSVAAWGGNVTEINIQALTITKSWQGYYGNVSGIVTLQDANNYTFYNWSMTNYNGRVFATRASSITWSLVNCTNGTNRTSEETYLGQTWSDSDSVTNTFNRTTHPSFSIGTQTIFANTCFTTNGFVGNNTQTANFPMLLLSQSNGGIVYTAIMNKTTTGFDSRPHDFELLVGENEKTGSVGSTTYYFWTEFS
jgi:hypothetical protein